MQNMITQLRKCPVLPVAIINNVEDALVLAECLESVGMNQIEIAFRTPNAAKSLKRIRDAFPNMLIGAGTLLTAHSVEVAHQLGADLGLAPGFDCKVIEQADGMGFPFVPGVFTSAELSSALRYGYKVVKYFPAEMPTGVGYLRSLSSAFEHTGIEFIPASANINDESITTWLSFKSVLCVATSWVCEPTLIENKRFSEIAERTKLMMRLSRSRV